MENIIKITLDQLKIEGYRGTDLLIKYISYKDELKTRQIYKEIIKN